jgi:hypothetical protein
MSTTAPGARAAGFTGPPLRSATVRARAYFASASHQFVQSVLELIWLLDGGPRFQSFVYEKGSIHMLTGTAPGQPSWLHESVIWGVKA